MTMDGSITPSIDDNPCWGGPEPNRHNLEYLLRVLGSTIDGRTSSSGDIVDNPPSKQAYSPEEYSAIIQRVREKLILYQDENYIAIHKPADLRMDGQFGATVHKLLLYLFPPPSLLQIASDGFSPAEDSTNKAENRLEHQMQLLKSIAPLSNRPFLKDDPHRPVHQLDYATSGVLLLAKSKKASCVACRSFEERKTNKQYVAVVVDPASSSASDDPPLGATFFGRLPALPLSALDHWVDGSLEKRYRKKRHRDMDEREGKRGTFDGYMPIHSVFDKWRAALLREKKNKENTQQQKHELPNIHGIAALAVKKNKRNKRRHDLPPLPNPKNTLTPGEIDELLLLPASWKAVKSHCAESNNTKWITIVETMTKEYNQLLLGFYAKKQPGQEESNGGGGGNQDYEKKPPASVANLPPLFRLKGDSIENENTSFCSQEENVFYICASIGEPKGGQFCVVVDPSATCAGYIDNNPTLLPLPELRPSLTKCTVLWRGFLDAPTVDRRIPVTKVLLQPCTGRRHQLRVHMAHVVGCPILGDAAYGGNLNVVEETNQRGSVCRRMCLHAKQLLIPLIGGETKSFVAPDPFVTIRKKGYEDESLMIL